MAVADLLQLKHERGYHGAEAGAGAGPHVLHAVHRHQPDPEVEDTEGEEGGEDPGVPDHVLAEAGEQRGGEAEVAAKEEQQPRHWSPLEGWGATGARVVVVYCLLLSSVHIGAAGLLGCRAAWAAAGLLSGHLITNIKR